MYGVLCEVAGGLVGAYRAIHRNHCTIELFADLRSRGFQGLCGPWPVVWVLCGLWAMWPVAWPLCGPGPAASREFPAWGF